MSAILHFSFANEDTCLTLLEYEDLMELLGVDEKKKKKKSFSSK